MSIPFSRSMRSLEADGSGRSLWPLALAVVLLGAWGAWFVTARLGRYEVTDRARLEVDRAVHLVQAPVAGRVTASNLVLGREVRAGEVLLEVDAGPQQLELAEARSRLAALEPEIRSLREQIAAEQRAGEEERQAGGVALEQARAQVREAEALTTLAASESARLARLKSEGLAPEREAEQAQAEARSRRAALEGLQLAASRIERELRKNQSDRQVRIDRLQGEITRIAGEQATASRTVDRLQYEIERRKVRAPVAGRLGEVAVLRVGGYVDEGDKLGTVIPAGEIRIIAEFLPPAALGRIRPGQPARLRLEGFPWTQYGAIRAEVTSVASEVRDGRVRVELAVRALAGSPAPIEHGLPGTVEVEVENVSPATLALRAAGLLAAPRTVFGTRAP